MEHTSIHLPLNPSQERMRFLDALDPRRTDLNISCAVELKRRMTTRQLHAALASILPSMLFLNVRLVKSGGRPVWRLDHDNHVLHHVILPEITCRNEANLAAHYAEFSSAESNLTARFPWRVQLVQMGDSSFLLCSFHHAICDGDRSLILFFDALAGCVDTREATAVAFDAPAIEEADWTAVSHFTKALTNPLDLRAMFARCGPEEYACNQIALNLHERTWPAEQAEAALFTALQALTANFVREEQIVVGVPAYGIATGSLDFGYFGTPGLGLIMPESVTGTGSQMLPDWAVLQSQQATRIGKIPYQSLMASRYFTDIANPERLFDILLVERKLFTFENCLVRRAFEPVPSRTPYLLTVNHWFDIEGGLQVRIEATSGLITQNAMDDFAHRLLLGLRGGQRPVACEVIKPGDYHAPFSSKPSHLLSFLTQARTRPEANAILSTSCETYSYRAVADRAEVLAEQLLSALGSGPATVAYAGVRHPDEIVALLGVSFASACFMRLDETETERHPVQLQTAGVDAVVTPADEPAAPEGFTAFGAETAGFRIFLADASAHRARCGDAYVVMTSGSTGYPKAIRFPNRQLARLIEWHVDQLPESDRVLQLSSLMHDVAYHEIFATLAAGRALVFAEQGLRQSPSDLIAFIDTMALDRIYLPTILLDGVARAALGGHRTCGALRMVIVAGGPLTITRPIRDWFSKTGAMLANHYGMSETQDITANVIAGRPESWAERPHVGRSIAGAEVTVVGTCNQPQPTGVIGNLAVRFDDMTPDTSMVLGDIGYRSTDDNFHILGRGDRVIKVRGHRISLEAIETFLCNHGMVGDAAAIAAPANARRQDPWVFVTGSPGHPGGSELEVLTEALVARLGKQAQCHLLPIDRLPRLKNEKTDYQCLMRRAHELAAAPMESEENEGALYPVGAGQDPITDAIRKLAPGTGFSDKSQLCDLGFDSLDLIGLELELSGFFPNLTVADFFNHPTIGALRRHLNGAIPAPTPLHHQVGLTVGNDTVSVVGMAGRFPGASGIDDLWKHLVSRQCLIGSAEPWRSGETSRFFVPSFGRLGDIDSFDHDFFGLSPAEAYRMDPQMRLFLELCWNALEHSGDAAYDDDTRIGLFAGAGLSTYLLNELEPIRRSASNCLFREDNTLEQRLGNDRNYLTSAASYRFGFTGPSVTVQAACATSLVAVHYARQALLNGECDIAIAGGVSVIWPEPLGYDYVEGSVRSPSGLCRPFDAAADGTVFSNGGGLVVLKRSGDAASCDNRVYAELLGTAVNHDGARKANFAAPSANGQTDVMRVALRNAGLTANDLNFIEAHGTATTVGDAIEWSSIGASLSDRSNGIPCAVGSVKGNIGHLDEGAGIAGFIKACLSVSERCFPGTCHFQSLNPSLRKNVNILVSAENILFGKTDAVTGGVSAFGMGGANAHAIVRSTL